MQSLEDILETNKEAVEKAEKYEYLKRDVEKLNQKMFQLKKEAVEKATKYEYLKRDMENLNQKMFQVKSYYGNLMTSYGFQEPYGPNDTQMDSGSRTW